MHCDNIKKVRGPETSSRLETYPVIIDETFSLALLTVKKKAQSLGRFLGAEQSLFSTWHEAMTHLSGDMEDC